MTSEPITPVLEQALRDLPAFSRLLGRLPLRSYQREVAEAVLGSVFKRRGLSFVVIFPRQSGKNELQAQLEAYLLALYSKTPAEMVKISPTWKPQSLNAMRRLQRVLEGNLLTQPLWAKEQGYIYRVGQARIFFLSGEPSANIVGATASTLLEVDEAQDVQIGKFDKEIAPMAASTNATRIFWGTAWTSATLLARELRAARAAEQQDGLRRAFVIDADRVAAEAPAYGRFVAAQVARLGRNHPMVRTQFYSEEVDAESGMFPPERQARLRGAHPRLAAPLPGRMYALLLDVAGEDSGLALAGELANPARDATALTVVEVDRSTLDDPRLRAPTYRVVDRAQWVGLPHPRLHAELLRLAGHWRACQVVIDATGVGAGLAGFLEQSLPGRVTPFTFTAASKSRLGWAWLSAIDAGRFIDWDPAGPDHDGLGGLFWRQLAACQMEPLPGPDHRLRWGVPPSARDPLTGAPLHDDLLLSAALAAVLDQQSWAPARPTTILPAPDPLRAMDREGY